MTHIKSFIQQEMGVIDKEVDESQEQGWLSAVKVGHRLVTHLLRIR